MKKHRSYLLITGLLISAPLLMAASRYSPESEYRDLSFTVENKTSPEDERRTYEFALTNTGKGYISYYEGFTYKAGDIRYTYMSPKVDNVLLNSELIKPGDEFTIVLSTDSDFNDYESGSFATYAYVDIDNSLEYVGSKSISQKERDDGSYFYTIDCEIKNMRDSYDYEYTFIVTINYEGKDYAFKSDLKYENTLAFSAKKDDFDMTKATVTDIKAVCYEVYHGPNYGAMIIGGMLYAVIIYGSIFLGVFFLIFFTILTIKTIKKRRMKKQAQDKQE